MTVPEVVLHPGRLYYLGPAQTPTLELESRSLRGIPEGGHASKRLARARFSIAAPGRRDGERLWEARLPDQLASGTIRFRIDLGAGCYDPPQEDGFYETRLRTIWLQDQQIYDYQPVSQVSESRVYRIDGLPGSRRPRRQIYVYLPRGYDQHTSRRYPVLFMQDGQNVFEAFEGDSYVGSWRADTTADQLIAGGQMRECVIIGVGHGGSRRIAEYLPPGMKIQALSKKPPAGAAKTQKSADRQSLASRWITGAAHLTYAFYQEDVACWMRDNLRVYSAREDTAVCGSSMGGLFALYVAFRHPEFARHYAALSPSFGLTEDEDGRARFFDLLRNNPSPEIRLWLDSGTLDAPNRGDDGLAGTRQARRILLEQGFVEGINLHFQVDEGAIHHEEAWAGRLPQVLRYLFPLE